MKKQVITKLTCHLQSLQEDLKKMKMNDFEEKIIERYLGAIDGLRFAIELINKEQGE